MRKTFSDTMLEVGQTDPKLVVLVGDIGHFALQPFAKACPGRYYNIGICEPTIVSIAAGLAHAGMYPVAHTIAPFIVERSFEQIKLDFGYQGLGGTLISVGSAFDYSGLGCSHHCYDDIALLKSIPGTQIVYPAMPKELNLLFKETYTNGSLTYFRLPANKHDVDIPDNQIRFGKAIRVKPGKDVTIVAAGPQLKTAMESLPALKAAGIDVEVIYPHTIKPFDYALITKSVNKTRKCLVVEEHTKFGGVGDEVMRAVQGIKDTKIAFINIPDCFIHGYGQYHEHCESLGLTKENVANEVKKLCI